MRHALPAIVEDAENSLTWSAREWLWALAAEWRALDQWIEETEHKIQRGFEHSDACQRLRASVLRSTVRMTARAPCMRSLRR